ncbi:hypothetical protein Daus18300_010369 [Diaporthe australafricana]|uniref:Uncharacterized protein n=1 Tax=Diaporthe australafricana TaxID=127596 RepID=A0ABR3WAB7_9PEZI
MSRPTTPGTHSRGQGPSPASITVPDVLPRRSRALHPLPWVQDAHLHPAGAASETPIYDHLARPRRPSTLGWGASETPIFVRLGPLDFPHDVSPWGSGLMPSRVELWLDQSQLEQDAKRNRIVTISPLPEYITVADILPRIRGGIESCIMSRFEETSVAVITFKRATDAITYTEFCAETPVWGL